MKRLNLNYFAGPELEKQNNFKNNRTRWVMPVIKILDKIGVTGNMISIFGLLLLIGFLYFIKSAPLVASIFLFFHVFLDAFDGSLARYQKKEGDAGSMMDMFCDHTGIVVVVGGLIYAGLLNFSLGYIYSYLYTILIILIILRNLIGRPIRVVFRTKYFVYALYLVWAIFGLNLLNYGVGLFILLMIWPTWDSFMTLQKYLKELNYGKEK